MHVRLAFVCDGETLADIASGACSAALDVYAFATVCTVILTFHPAFSTLRQIPDEG
jgi:hypothetical protein